MSCCKDVDDEKHVQHKKINKEIAVDRKKTGRTVKLLLLGAGDSGKSTVAKQMKIIHLDGFSDEEKRSYRTAISSNVLASIKMLVHMCNKYGYHFQQANEIRAQRIMDIPREQEPMVTQQLAEDIVNLWQDPAIKTTFARSSEYQLNDSTTYYFEKVNALAQPDYVPNDQDIVRSRVKTTGVLETSFEIEDIMFRLVDVGGQRSERRKWIHCFEDVTAIIFCVAMSEYDLRLYEDNETNRMQESLQLFRELCTTKWFINTSFILFLNKTDLFDEKIKRVPLTVCFPEYNGDTKDVVTSGKEYIRDKFVALNENTNKQIYAHFTTATDTNNIEYVFNAVRDIILARALHRIGVL